MDRNGLFQIIERADGKSIWSQVYDVFMLLTIVVSVVPLAFWDEYPCFIYIEWVTTAVFIVDYLLRWLTADIREGKSGIRPFVTYPFTFWAIIDLVSILPSFNFLGKGFKIVRTIRLLKLLRLLKALRYSQQVLIFFDVLKKERKVLYSVLVISVCYIFITALIMFNCEPRINPDSGEPTFNSYFDALYWATVTLTTVGYGDMCPVSDIGRLVSMLSAVFGIAVIALPSGIITASYLDELKEIKGVQFAERLKKSFRRVLCRATDHHPTYYIVPRKVPVIDVQVKQGMSMQDIIDTAERYPEFRLRNMASTIPASQQPEDRIVIEHFMVNRPYGCMIDRGSKVTIVSPCSYNEAGIGSTAYYLALIGGFNYISKELEMDRDEPISFYNIDEMDENLSLFLSDLKSLASKEGSWVVTLASSSSSRDSQMHFLHGRKKSDNGYGEEQHCCLIDTETYDAMYHETVRSMSEKFDLKVCQHDFYCLNSKNISYKVGGGETTNAFALRISYGLTCWDDNRMDKVQTLAEILKKHLEPDVALCTPDILKEKGFGYYSLTDDKSTRLLTMA